MKIHDFVTDRNLIANEVQIFVNYHFEKNYFNINMDFYNESGQVGCTGVYITPEIITEWHKIAEKEPQKAGFLDFTIITEWACRKSGIVPLDPTTFS